MKKFVSVLIAFALGAALGAGIVLKSCGPDKAYWVERAIYDKAVAAREEQLKDALAMITEAGQIINEKDNDLAAREAKIDGLEAQTADYFTELDALAKETAVLKVNAEAVIAANPAVRALVDNFELRLAAYGRQVFTLSAVITEERAAKADWIAKYDAAILQRDAWQGQYDDEHALRLTSDALRTGLERKLYGGKFWAAVGKGSTVYWGIRGGIKLAQAIFGK